MGPLADGDRALLDYAVKLTRDPARARPGDLDRLRAHGFSDAAIHRLVHIVGFFNYYNRLASGLGVADEPEWAERRMPPWLLRR
jgi:uncharacterized peroxidase-related enzyme